MKQIATIVIGGSVGAIETLNEILTAFPPDLAAPVVVVVHMGPQDPGLLPGLFSPRCRMRVKEAEDKEPLSPGTIYFAPVDYHLLIEQDRTFSLSCDDPVNYSRPSIDVLFESIAVADGGAVLAIILSGANSDGVMGAKAIVRKGGSLIVQSPGTALCSTMPTAAIEQCPGARVVPVKAIAKDILHWVAENRREV